MTIDVTEIDHWDEKNGNKNPGGPGIELKGATKRIEKNNRVF